MNAEPIDILVLAPQFAHAQAPRMHEYILHDYDSIAALGASARKIRGLITDGTRGAPRDLLEALPNLEIISVCGVGYDRIDLETCRRRQIKVTTARGVLSADVADMAFALTLGVLRRTVAADRFVRAGDWSATHHFPLSTSLKGKRMGIVGMGDIGIEIARRAQAFGMEVGYHNRRVKEESPLSYHPNLITIARWSDVLVLCLPGGDATRQVVNKDVLDALGPDGFLINVARGSVIDEPALISALQEKRIKGAGLDVFADEPHVPPALTSCDNVVLQPHIASATQETRTEMAALVFRNLDAQFAARPLLTPLAF
ncbi:MAG: 2-hydroxyacid dehydrogenase [Acetobacteraceae bacterium]